MGGARYSAADTIKDLGPRGRDQFLPHVKRNGQSALSDLHLTMGISDWFAPVSHRGGCRPARRNRNRPTDGGSGARFTRSARSYRAGFGHGELFLPWVGTRPVDRPPYTPYVIADPLDIHHGFPRMMRTLGRWGNGGSARKPTTDIPGLMTYPAGDMSSIGCGLSWQAIWRAHGRILEGWRGSSTN